MVGEKIWLSSPHMSDEGYEMEYIKEAFATNWVAPLGENVDKFEEELAAKIGAKHAAALSSGTAAIHLSMKAAGVGPGAIVFCQSLTLQQPPTPSFISTPHRYLSIAIMRHGIWTLRC